MLNDLKFILKLPPKTSKIKATIRLRILAGNAKPNPKMGILNIYNLYF